MIRDQFTIPLDELAAVVIATAGIYVVFLVLVRVLGARALTQLSVVDLAAVVALGAVLGRSALLEHPRLITGAIALLELFVLQVVVGGLRRIPAVDRVVSPRPVVLVADGEVDGGALARTRISEHELRYATRNAGVSALRDVAYLVLEPNGSITVIRAGDEVDPWLVADLTSPART
ncbi:MAG: DUF421 domain-containing protein [Nocardioidaceae bacterium]|nr:DUF421 domain-containing protein [Nocardioidaceae bacterium]MCL2613811.1 DUF421 domain-containing protein [Nocardioidaceae bacterium]